MQAPADVKVNVEKIETESAELSVKVIEVTGTPSGRAFRVILSGIKQGDQCSTVRFTVGRTGVKAQILAVQVSCFGDSLN